MVLFGPKGFAAEVSEGIDLESRITLSGDRITIGNGSLDDLCLGAGDIVPAHLTFQRRPDGKWDYFTTGRAETQIDKGNNRTGRVRAGMWFKIGRETKITIKRAEVVVDETTPKDSATTIPMSIVVPVILGMLALAVLFMMASQSDTDDASGLRTSAWFTGQADLSEALDICLSHDLAPPAYATASAIDGAFWVYMGASDSATRAQARTQLLDTIRKTLSETHLLSNENKGVDASNTLRRIEYVLPLERLSCPILSAARVDIALLEMRGN